MREVRNKLVSIEVGQLPLIPVEWLAEFPQSPKKIEAVDVNVILQEAKPNMPMANGDSAKVSDELLCQLQYRSFNDFVCFMMVIPMA